MTHVIIGGKHAGKLVKVLGEEGNGYTVKLPNGFNTFVPYSDLSTKQGLLRMIENKHRQLAWLGEMLALFGNGKPLQWHEDTTVVPTEHYSGPWRIKHVEHRVWELCGPSGITEHRTLGKAKQAAQ